MKKIILVLTLALVLVLSGCTVQQTADEKQHDQQETILQEATQQTGMPDIHNFFERKMMKKILEKRDDSALNTYTYVKNANGKFIYIGRTIGYGLPYSTQYTNPQKIERQSQGGYAILPQADPNGLFSPASSEATWLLLVNEKTNEAQVFYEEERITVYESKLPRRLCEEYSLPADY